MSEKKRKPQVIHVNKLIVKANEVIIQEDREHHDHKDDKHDKHEEQREERREERRDPWGFFGSTNRAEVQEEANQEEGERKNPEDENSGSGGFSWF